MNVLVVGGQGTSGRMVQILRADGRQALVFDNLAGGYRDALLGKRHGPRLHRRCAGTVPLAVDLYGFGRKSGQDGYARGTPDAPQSPPLRQQRKPSSLSGKRDTKSD